MYEFAIINNVFDDQISAPSLSFSPHPSLYLSRSIHIIGIVLHDSHEVIDWLMNIVRRILLLAAAISSTPSENVVR
jgi:hypothetical protein